MEFIHAVITMKQPQCFAHVITAQRPYINNFQLSCLIFNSALYPTELAYCEDFQL